MLDGNSGLEHNGTPNISLAWPVELVLIVQNSVELFVENRGLSRNRQDMSVLFANQAGYFITYK